MDYEYPRTGRATRGAEQDQLERLVALTDNLLKSIALHRTEYDETGTPYHDLTCIHADLAEGRDETMGRRQAADRLAVKLCLACRAIIKGGHADQLIYNGRVASQRSLAEWFEKHEKADKEAERLQAAKEFWLNLITPYGLLIGTNPSSMLHAEIVFPSGKSYNMSADDFKYLRDYVIDQD